MFCAALVSLWVGAVNASGWTHVSHQKDVHVYTRPVAGFSIDEVCATLKVDVAPQAIWNVLEDVTHFPEFIPYVTESKILQSTRLPSGLVCQTEYHRVAPPLIKGRDYTLIIESEVIPAQKKFVRRWRTANDQGPKEREDAVRVHVASGSWTVEQLAGQKTQLTYKLLTEPGGSVPGWLANRANRASLPDLLEAVHMRARQQGAISTPDGA